MELFSIRIQRTFQLVSTIYSCLSSFRSFFNLTICGFESTATIHLFMAALRDDVNSSIRTMFWDSYTIVSWFLHLPILTARYKRDRTWQPKEESQA